MDKRLKLLVSNDEVEFIRDYGRALEQSGMEVVYVPKDGAKLLEKIELLHPDVVLADLFMPHIDAFGVMKSCSDRMVNKPFFVIVSSTMSPVLEREVMNAGASYLAVYPFNPTDLAQRIFRIAGYTVGSKYREQTIDNTQSLEIQVTEILHQIGVPAHIKGYHYLRDSIIMSIETPEIINAVTKQLYPSVAKRYNTTSSRVERAIRHVIEVAWDRGDVDVLNTYFGYTIHNTRGKPTNSEFIAMISDRLRLHMKSA